MGNQLLIRGAGVVLAVAITLQAEITINDIDRLVNDIKQERIGLTDKEIREAKDPFIYPGGRYSRVLKAKGKRKRTRFVLTAIINDRVKINRRWYSLNGNVGGYTVKDVGRNFVVLAKNGEQIRVYLTRKKNKKIKLLVK